MENDKGSMVDDFLSQVNEKDTTLKDQNPFANLDVELKEEAVKEEPKEEEKPLPYHEDPKLQKYLSKREKEIEEKIIKNLSSREEQKFREEVKEDGFIKAFETIIGNDTPEKIRALEALKNEVESIRQEARSTKQELEAERQADAEAEQELIKGFETVEDEFGVNFSDKKLRSDFIEFIERVAPKDEYGEIKDYPDFVETFRTYQELNKRSNSKNKELASRSIARSGDASKVPMPEDTSWRGVEKFFSSLKG